MLEPADVEQSLEQPFPRVMVGLQEVGEPSLRQHDHLKELFGGHAQQPADLKADVVVALGHHIPAGFGPSFEQGGRVHPDAAPAAAFRPVPGSGAGDPVPAPGQAELQADPWLGPGVGVMRPQVLRTGTQPRDGAVESEAERVEQGGLPTAGLAAQQYQATGPKAVEVQLDPAGERAEGGEFQMVGTHQAASSDRRASSSAAWSNERSPSLGSARTWVTNASATARSERPRIRWR